MDFRSKIHSVEPRVTLRGRTYELQLSNFAGVNYPTLHAEWMRALLDIRPEERLLTIQGEEVDAGSSRERGWTGSTDRQEEVASLDHLEGALPFSDGEFDIVACRMALHRIADPALACQELMRVAKRGFIETPAPLTAYLGADPADRWLVSVERIPGEEPTLLFRPRAFIRPPFYHALRARFLTDPDFRFRWEWQFRNVMHTQFAWEGSFRFRVEGSPCNPLNYDYENPFQVAEAHLDRAICGLRFGNLPVSMLMPDVERALMLLDEPTGSNTCCVEAVAERRRASGQVCEASGEASSAIGQHRNRLWAVAQNTRGCLLWLERRYEQSGDCFEEAARLNPTQTEYLHNCQMVLSWQRNRDQAGKGTNAGSVGAESVPHLALLSPTRAECEDIATNFGGKVYYAFVNFDDRLAQDMGIQPGDRVLDVGGGQRPLRRADVNIDFDVFEGLHRQGQAVSRDRPLVCGDVQRLPFRTGAFDVACCRMVLEHVLDPVAACKELQRVARRGFLETPNTFWECFYGHPTHRWLIEWEEATRTLVFRRKPFDQIPFRSAIVPFLYRQREIQRAFEITYRNLTTTQIRWDEANPFSVRLEDDPDCPYDYLAHPEEATRGSLNYSRDLLESGLPAVAIAEAEDALHQAPNVALRTEAARLRLRIAELLGEKARQQEMRALLRDVERVEQTLPGGSISSLPLLPIMWQAPLRDPSGYADEARHFLFALASAGMQVSARAVRWSDRVAVLSATRERLLQQLLSRPALPGGVNVCHILAPCFRRDPQARFHVGRTMFETDRLPAGWVEACNQMDAIWVPGAFNLETFARAGVRREKLAIVPGAIDLAPYDPNCAPLKIAGARGFNFLSVFDWTLRKGWDLLIRAFVEEFRPEEDVALLLKTHSSLGYTGQQMMGFIASYLVETLHRDPNRIPDIVVQDANVPDTRMPNLYRAADCYVMPSRGEGWGRPYMEAMAMGLPVIATAWGGQTAFMNAENSYPLDYTLVDVPEVAWQETPTYQGHRWAEPSCAHLRQLLRRAFEDRAEGRLLGQRARAHLETHFTYTPVATIIANEIAKI